MVTITLPQQLEQAVAEQARQQGTTPELLALESLRRQFLPETEATPADGSRQSEQTLAERFAGRVGRVSFDPPDLSMRAEEYFGRIVLEKQRRREGPTDDVV